MVVRRVTKRTHVKKVKGIAELVAVISGIMLSAGMTRHESQSQSQGMGI